MEKGFFKKQKERIKEKIKDKPIKKGLAVGALSLLVGGGIGKMAEKSETEQIPDNFIENTNHLHSGKVIRPEKDSGLYMLKNGRYEKLSDEEEKEIKLYDYDKNRSLEDILQDLNISEKAGKSARVILAEYERLKGSNFLPTEIFDEALLLAIMQKESAFKPEAISSSNAVGLMQNKEVSIRDLIESFNRFKNSKRFGFEYLSSDILPEEISIDEAHEVLEVIKQSEKLSEAAGALYLGVLLHRYKIGKEELEQGLTEEAMQKILAAYNLGWREVENGNMYQAEDYYEYILKHRQKIKAKLEQGKGREEIIADFRNFK